MLRLVGVGCVALSCSQPDAREDVHWFRDLHRAARVADAHPVAVNEITIAEKTDRVLVRYFGDRFVFTPVDLPGGSRVGLRYRILSDAAYPHESIEVRVGFDDRLYPPEILTLTSPAGVGRWNALDVEVPTRAPARRMEIAFAHPGLPRPRTEVAILRPHAWIPAGPVPPAAPARRAILITLDTVRRDHVGAHGDARARTPELDAFARDAVRFDDAFSVSNVTNPSHTSIFTSLYPKDHGVEDNFTKLDTEAPTLMQRLREAGFRTAAFVSAFNFEPDRSDFGARFDDFHAPTGYFERRAEDVNADVFEWLAGHREGDSFAWIHYFDAHMPYHPPAPFDDLPLEGEPETVDVRLESEALRKWMRATDDLRVYRSRYRGEIAYLDQQLGELFGYLKRLGIYDPSLIVITSDHGESLGEHRIYCDHVGLYDETTAVPLLIKLPESEYRGARAGLASTLDIYPTLFDYLGVPVSDALRGRSLRARIEGDGGGWSEVYAEHAKGVQVTVRTPSHRMLRGLVDYRVFPRFSIEEGRRELYDVRTDPGQVRELGGRAPEVARALERRLAAYLEDRRPARAVPIEDEEYRRQLEALGYAR